MLTGADPKFYQGVGAASEAESCWHSEVESHKQSKQFVARATAHLKAIEVLGFSVLKYAFSHILKTLFFSFLTFSWTPKIDEIAHCISINCIFFQLFKKVMPFDYVTWEGILS